VRTCCYSVRVHRLRGRELPPLVPPHPSYLDATNASSSHMGEVMMVLDGTAHKKTRKSGNTRKFGFESELDQPCQAMHPAIVRFGGPRVSGAASSFKGKHGCGLQQSEWYGCEMLPVLSNWKDKRHESVPTPKLTTSRATHAPRALLDVPPASTLASHSEPSETPPLILRQPVTPSATTSGTISCGRGTRLTKKIAPLQLSSMGRLGS
jgi:hypothetical protein